MLTCVKLGVLLGGALLHAGAVASQVVDLAPLPGYEFKEHIDEPRPISGALVTGLSLTTRQHLHTQPDALYVLLEDGLRSGERLSVEIESPDGRYRGTGNFQGQAPAGSWARIRLWSSDAGAERPRLPTIDELAVYASRSGESDGRQPKRLVVKWSNDAGDQLKLQINSGRSQRVWVEHALDASTEPEVLPCSPVEHPTPIVYDTVCLIPLERFSRGNSEIQIVRRRGFARDAASFKLALPAAP